MTQEKLPHRKELCLQSETIAKNSLFSLYLFCVSLFYYCVFVEILYNKIKWVYGRKRFLGALVRRPRNVR